MDSKWIENEFPDLSDIVKIEEGGQKMVFKATHKLHGFVALKLLKKGGETERLEREILASKLIKSNHLPKVFDEGVVKGVLGEYHWVTEQFIDGVNLRKYLTEHGPMSLLDTVKLIETILDVLLVAHDQRIIHRDLKPENIMVDTTGSFWVLDFGLARHLNLTTLTQHQVAMGTLGYSPPEQMRGQKSLMDPRTDFFPLGIMFYECLTGVNPFRVGATNYEEIKHRIMRHSLPSISEALDPTGGLSELISTMTHKFTNQRPESVKEIQDWLKDIKASLNI